MKHQTRHVNSRGFRGPQKSTTNGVWPYLTSKPMPSGPQPTAGDRGPDVSVDRMFTRLENVGQENGCVSLSAESDTPYFVM